MMIQMCVCVCVYLYDSVFPLAVAPQRGEKVDVCALDKLPMGLTQLLLSLSTPEQCCP